MSGGTVSYTINIGANISKVKEAMKEVSQLLSNSNLDKGITSSYERKLGKLSNALVELENKASQPIKTDAELRDVERSIKKGVFPLADAKKCLACRSGNVKMHLAREWLIEQSKKVILPISAKDTDLSGDGILSGQVNAY